MTRWVDGWVHCSTYHLVSLVLTCGRLPCPTLHRAWIFAVLAYVALTWRSFPVRLCFLKRREVNAFGAEPAKPWTSHKMSIVAFVLLWSSMLWVGSSPTLVLILAGTKYPWVGSSPTLVLYGCRNESFSRTYESGLLFYSCSRSFLLLLLLFSPPLNKKNIT